VTNSRFGQFAGERWLACFLRCLSQARIAPERLLARAPARRPANSNCWF